MPNLSLDPYLHPGADIQASTLGRYVEIGEGSRIVESCLGDYSYTDRYADIAYSTLGKFVNVALSPASIPANTLTSVPRFTISCIAQAIIGQMKLTRPIFLIGGAQGR